MLIPQLIPKHENNDCAKPNGEKWESLWNCFSHFLWVQRGKQNWILKIKHFISAVRRSDERLFACVKISALSQPDVCSVSFHLSAPIILSPARLSSWASLYILPLLLISLPMTCLTEEAVVLCFQLTLRRVSEPWSARRGRLLLLGLSAVLASSPPCVLFNQSDIPGLFQDHAAKWRNVAFYSRRMFY